MKDENVQIKKKYADIENQVQEMSAKLENIHYNALSVKRSAGIGTS